METATDARCILSSPKDSAKNISCDFFINYWFFMTVKIYQNLRKAARNLFWLRKSVQESRDLDMNSSARPSIDETKRHQRNFRWPNHKIDFIKNTFNVRRREKQNQQKRAWRWKKKPETIPQCLKSRLGNIGMTSSSDFFHEHLSMLLAPILLWRELAKIARLRRFTQATGEQIINRVISFPQFELTSETIKLFIEVHRETKKVRTE